eukprot:SAG25_NODE_1040_length_4198_cov_15.883407_4_plen_48_part_00
MVDSRKGITNLHVPVSPPPPVTHTSTLQMWSHPFCGDAAVLLPVTRT